MNPIIGLLVRGILGQIPHQGPSDYEKEKAGWKTPWKNDEPKYGPEVKDVFRRQPDDFIGDDPPNGPGENTA